MNGCIKAKQKFEIDYIDQSSLNECDRCPAKYMFDRLMGLSLPDSTDIAPDYGTDMHLALPLCYQEDVSCVEIAMGAFMASWSRRSYGNMDTGRNPARARASLLEFHRLRKPSMCPYTISPLSKQIEAPTADLISDNEMPFLIDIGGDLCFCGRIDAPVIMNSTNDLWALDYKTASEVSERYFNNFSNSPQAVGYTLGLATVSKQPVTGFIVEAIRTSKKNVETTMKPIFINEHQIEMFIYHANRTARDILRWNEEQSWPQKTSGCAPYGMFYQPGRFCEYRDLCLLGDWREMEKYFVKSEPFHPFKLKV